VARGVGLVFVCNEGFVMSTPFNASGAKYLRPMRCLVDGQADVYAVLDAFGVTCPARAHAIKKLLCAGLRGKGSEYQDLAEARDAVERAMQMQVYREQSDTEALGPVLKP
jgi:hypothetical protein